MTDLTARKQALVAYARSCLEAGDWHGLWDCAIDLYALDQRMAGQAEANDRRTAGLRFPYDASKGDFRCQSCGAWGVGNHDIACPLAQTNASRRS